MRVGEPEEGTRVVRVERDRRLELRLRLRVTTVGLEGEPSRRGRRAGGRCPRAAAAFAPSASPESAFAVAMSTSRSGPPMPCPRALRGRPRLPRGRRPRGLPAADEASLGPSPATRSVADASRTRPTGTARARGGGRRSRLPRAPGWPCRRRRGHPAVAHGGAGGGEVGGAELEALEQGGDVEGRRTGGEPWAWKELQGRLRDRGRRRTQKDRGTPQRGNRPRSPRRIDQRGKRRDGGRRRADASGPSGIRSSGTAGGGSRGQARDRRRRPPPGGSPGLGREERRPAHPGRDDPGRRALRHRGRPGPARPRHDAPILRELGVEVEKELATARSGPRSGTTRRSARPTSSSRRCGPRSASWVPARPPQAGGGLFPGGCVIGPRPIDLHLSGLGPSGPRCASRRATSWPTAGACGAGDLPGRGVRPDRHGHGERADGARRGPGTTSSSMPRANRRSPTWRGSS